MKLIVDATVLFTALIGTGVTKDIIFSDAVALYSPEYLFEELEEHKSRINEFSSLSSDEVDVLFEKLRARITSAPREQFEKFLKEANRLVSDKKVFTTSELVKYLKSTGHKF